MAGRYSRAEIERRFIIDAVPEGVCDPRRIEDRYVHGTRIRVRVVTGSDGAQTFKLGQKQPLPQSVSAVMHTTMYLDAAEFSLLAGLPASRLTKTRYAHPDAPGWAVDVFDGVLSGLVTAEYECADFSEHVECPWPGADVTEDVRFTGAQLAGLDPWQAAQLLSEAWRTS